MPRLSPGLVSVTFRQLGWQDIIEQTVAAGLAGIEWGGDIHVPHGDLARAQRVGRACSDAGLAVPTYGSYYRLGQEAGTDNPGFAAVLDTAEALGSRHIRVWPGVKGSAEAGADYRKRVAEEALALGAQARKRGMKLVYEYHGGTLTDSVASAEQLLKDTAHPGIDTLWQPINGADEQTNLASVHSVLPRLVNVHVFHWRMTHEGIDRRPLAEGRERWLTYFREIRQTGRDHACLIEFVRGDSLDMFHQDARVLKELLAAGP